MQSLQFFPPDLNRSRRMEVSNLFQSDRKLPSIYENSSQEFIPFQRERDGIGRLLSKTKRDNPQIQQSSIKTYRSGSQQLQRERDEENEQIMKASKMIESFFRKIDIQSKELKRVKVQPKKGILIVDKERKNAKPTNQYYDVEVGLDKVKLRRKDCNFRKQSKPVKSKSMKLLQWSSMSKGKQILDNKKQKEEEDTEKKQGSNKVKKEAIDKIPKAKVTFQHPQLKRYRQFKKLQIKVFKDFERGHEKFKQKMQTSKMIAQRIKKQLQLE